MSSPAILILAAGASSRMGGRDKLMETVDGQPLLTVICRRAALTGLPCYVAVPSHSHPRTGATGTATCIPVPNAEAGMGISIATGVAALPKETGGVLILPADLPEIETQDLMHIAAHFHGPDGPILRATSSEGRPGHPVLFPRRYFDSLCQLTGDMGGRELLQREPVQTIPLPGNRATTDLDTPEAWAAWRSRSL